MNQFHRLNIKYVQSMEAVSRPLNEGIVSISNICKSLSNAHVNPTTDICSNYNKIRNHIEHAEQCLKTSESMIKEKLGYLDECMERLIREKQNVQQQKKNKSLYMGNVRIKMNSSKESFKHSKAALEQAEKNVKSAKDAIRIHQHSMSTYDDVATAGVVLLAIPILGWIAGPIMITEGQKASEAAFNAIKDAEWEKQSSDSEVRKWTAKVYYYENIISRTQNEIKQTNEALKECEWELKEIQKHLEDTGNIQEMVRRAVTLLSIFSGRVTVLERQTQRFILWDPVVKAMEDVMKAVVTIAENQLLYSRGVPDFINALRENFGRLLALCNSHRNSEWKSYF